jgi:transposase
MRFVPVKSIEQQAVLSLHRVRQGFVKARTAQANQIRGLLSEFGLIMPAGISHIAKRVPSLLEDASNPLPGSLRHLITRLTEHLKDLDMLVDEFEARSRTWHRSSELSMKLEKIPGIGPLGASAWSHPSLDANSFANGRQLSAWLGLVPRQHSSGGKPALLGISKARRCLSAHAAHPWCPLGDPGGTAQGRELQRLAGRPARPPPSQRGGRCTGEQERSNGLGAVGTRTRVPTQLRRATTRRVEDAGAHVNVN